MGILEGLIIIFFSISSLKALRTEVEEIEYASFVGDKLFYTSTSKKMFGFISTKNGQFITKQQLNENQSIIKIDQQAQIMVLRKQRNKALVFQLNSLLVREIKIKITFQHQRLVDLVQKNNKVYTLTDKDLRIYDANIESMDESLTYIYSSGRKKQWFLKIFLFEQSIQPIIRIVLSRDQQICIRNVTLDKKYEQRCLFNVSSAIHSIESIGSSILIQTKSLNYVIRVDNFVYSFRGKILQFDKNYACMEEQFRSFDFNTHKFVPGHSIYGSTKDHLFWLKHNETNSISIVHNGQIITQLQEKFKPKRTWINQTETNLFLLFIQFEENSRKMYSIHLEESRLIRQWPKQPTAFIQTEL